MRKLKTLKLPVVSSSSDSTLNNGSDVPENTSEDDPEVENTNKTIVSLVPYPSDSESE